MKVLLAVIAAMLVCPPAFGAVTTLDFESLTDLELVTNQFPGLIFSNTVALQSFSAVGGSLNDADFPPRSGITVVSNGGVNAIGEPSIGGAIVIDFTTPVSSVGGFFTYGGPLTLTAFNTAHTQVAQVSSAFSENFVSSGGTPNELLQAEFAGGIAELRIDIAPGDATFTLDDLTFAPVVSTAVPEPAALVLIVASVLGLLTNQTLFVRVRRIIR
jgi:hypothetical protein